MNILEVAGVPLMISGPGIAAGKHVATPASHVDTYPFIMECVGEDRPEMYDGHPGVSLTRLAHGEAPPGRPTPRRACAILAAPPYPSPGAGGR